MREAPAWFNAELARIGGTNPYGEPVFRLVWSTTQQTVIGGRWEQSGFEGYKIVPGVPGEPCWALMVWEPREMQGSPQMWEYDYRDPETGYMQCGGYPKYGRYRLVRRFLHREMITKSEMGLELQGTRLVPVERRKAEFITYRMEPNGLMLDLMLPMLIKWRRLSDEAKLASVLQEEQLKEQEFHRKASDIRNGVRVRRGSQLVAKRAELIEKGFMQTMAIAAKSGLGMRIGDNG